MGCFFFFRVGPLGFLYQDNGKEDAALGNFGIWDQIESLKWVQKHITKFGGDKDQVKFSVFSPVKMTDLLIYFALD